MDNNTVTISMDRDVAHYLSMLLADQLVGLDDTPMTEHIVPIRRAYERVNEELERALAIPRALTQTGASKTTYSMAPG